MTECPLCKNHIDDAKVGYIDEETYEVNCDYCGVFFLPEAYPKELKKEQYYPKLAFWIHEQNEAYNTVPTLDMTKLEEYKNIIDKTLTNRYEIFLRCCNNVDEMVFHKLSTWHDNNSLLCKTTWSKSDNDLMLLVNKALHENHITIKYEDSERIEYTIAFDGKMHLENLIHQNNSNKIFMAFQFNDEMKEQFEPAIRKAVADASDNRLEAVRVSSSTTDHDTKIDDELIAMLKSSKAVIADFTGQRNAVYYEAGYAMGLGIPVIWTCMEDDVEELSFDTRQYPHIIWKDKDDLYKQVVNRLKAKIL